MSYSIRVFDSRIHAMSMPGGMVYNWTRNLTREIALRASVEAPAAHEDWGLDHLPGLLKVSHDYNATGNGLGVFGTVTNHAHYARYVHEGTRTPITPRYAPYMKFTINGRTFRRQVVRGQEANPWLARAMAIVLAKHGIT